MQYLKEEGVKRGKEGAVVDRCVERATVSEIRQELNRKRRR